MHALLKLLLALLPLALTILFAWLVMDSYLNFGGGEKDMFIAVPLLLWSSIYLLCYLVLWWRRVSTARMLALSAGWATGVVAVAWVALLGFTFLSAPAKAQAPTARPVRIVVPFAVGGPTDIIARVLAPRLSESLKRPVIVENKVGATGAIGASLVAKAAPDGDTLLLGTSSIMAASPNLVANLSYDPVRDFVPISLVATIESILVVHPSVPASNVRELVAHAKANPGKLSYASSGIGSTYHLSAELFASQAGIQWTHVPYKGAAPAIQDVLAGHVQVMFDNVSSAIPNIRAGKLKALGVASLQRYPPLPDLPTVAEQGVPGYTTTIWLGLFAPARTPAPILQVLQKEIGAAVGAADYKDKLLAIEIQPQASTSGELARYLKSDLAKWAKVVKDAGIKPE